MKTPWKAFLAALGAFFAAVAYIVWKALADKRELERAARQAAVNRLGFYDMQQLKTPEEHREAFDNAVAEATVALSTLKKEEIQDRFNAAFGGGK
jgi:hypothetical protein